MQTYTIEGIDYNKNAQSTFSARNRKTGKEEKMTYFQYYRHKGEEIEYPNLVLLKSTGRNGHPIHLIPEFCLLTDM